MSKDNKHPEYHIINVKMTDGSTYQTRSTWGSEGDTLVLAVDPLVHNAWTGSAEVHVGKGGSVEKFKKRFGDVVSLQKQK